MEKQIIEDEEVITKNYFLIPFNKIAVEPGFNCRINYGTNSFTRLKNDIEQNGVQEPIRVIANPNKKGHYLVREGHRRMRAVELLVKAGVKMKRTPAIVTKETIEESYKRMHSSNSTSKPFSNIEKGFSIEKLVKYGWSIKQITLELGLLNDNETYFCLSITKLPKKYHKKLSTGELSDNMMVSLFRQYKENPEKAEKEVIRAEKQATLELQKKINRDERNGKNVDKKEKPKVSTRHLKSVSFASATSKLREALIRANNNKSIYDKDKVLFLSTICAILESPNSTTNEIAEQLKL